MLIQLSTYPRYTLYCSARACVCVCGSLAAVYITLNTFPTCLHGCMTSTVALCWRGFAHIHYCTSTYSFSRYSQRKKGQTIASMTSASKTKSAKLLKRDIKSDALRAEIVPSAGHFAELKTKGRISRLDVRLNTLFGWMLLRSRQAGSVGGAGCFWGRLNDVKGWIYCVGWRARSQLADAPVSSSFKAAELRRARWAVTAVAEEQAASAAAFPKLTSLLLYY